ncbi:MAG TPA: hypothetical protein VN247_07065, partial [Arenimonas sp.]|nr:hypothetical protein [Arenimonas sp.]
MSKIQSFANNAHAWILKNPWKTGSIFVGVMALWFAIQGADLYQQNKSERDALTLRDTAIKKIQPYSASLIEKMQQTAAQFTTANSLTDLDAVKAVFENALKDAELVQFQPINMQEAYQNIEKFGVGKLAVLESASNDSKVAIRIIKV